jgi:hypothetical protein
MRAHIDPPVSAVQRGSRRSSSFADVDADLCGQAVQQLLKRIDVADVGVF